MLLYISLVGVNVIRFNGLYWFGIIGCVDKSCINISDLDWVWFVGVDVIVRLVWGFVIRL